MDTKMLSAGNRGNMAPGRDYYVLMDISSPDRSYAAGMRYLLRQFLRTAARPQFNRQEVYLTVIVFNHEYRVLIDRVRLDRLDVKYYSQRIDSIRFGGATNPVRPLVWALENGLRDASVRRATYGNHAALPPAYLFWGEGKPDIGDPAVAEEAPYDARMQRRLEREFADVAERIRSLTRSGQILFFAYGFDSLRSRADRKTLYMLSEGAQFVNAGLPNSAFVLPSALPVAYPACAPLPHREHARLLAGADTDKAKNAREQRIP